MSDKGFRPDRQYGYSDSINEPMSQKEITEIVVLLKEHSKLAIPSNYHDRIEYKTIPYDPSGVDEMSRRGYIMWKYVPKGERNEKD